VIEANMVGTPAVGYNIGGLRDSILHMKTGLLTEENTPEALFEGISKLIEDKLLYNRLSRNAFKWSKTFNWEKAGRESLSIIEQIYGKRIWAN
jgi:glycosyltransferase involved in cell wall biosynthesis